MFDTLIFAEAAVNDSRGAMTVIGLNQRVIAPAATPFNMRQRVVMTFSDEVPGSLGKEFGELPGGSVSIRVLDPDGLAVFAVSEDIEVPKEKRWTDLPLLATLVVDIDIKGDAYGIYVVEVMHRGDGLEEQIRRVPIYIVNPSIAVSAPVKPAEAFALNQ